MSASNLLDRRQSLDGSYPRKPRMIPRERLETSSESGEDEECVFASDDETPERTEQLDFTNVSPPFWPPIFAN